jgi:hypothetical protein
MLRIATSPYAVKKAKLSSCENREAVLYGEGLRTAQPFSQEVGSANFTKSERSEIWRGF